jgi:hypothetical protein
MSVWNGLGGGITVGAGVELPVSKHTVRKISTLADVSHSGSSARMFHSVIPHYEWEIELPFDDTRMVDVDEGLVEGASVTLRFDDGSSGKFLILTGTSVESIEEVEDVLNDVIRVAVRGKGGVLTRQVT